MTAVASSTAWGIAPDLRRLYVVRFGFAVVWAVLLFLTISLTSHKLRRVRLEP